MPTTDVPAGTIEYDDTGGSGPVIVFLHGLFMSGTTWREVVPRLRDDYRCITPTLPLGSHRIAMKPDADLTMHGQTHLVADFLEALDLRDVTLVSIDWGGGLFLTAEGRDDRVARLVICPSEAYDNFPPGLSGKVAMLACRLPGGVGLGLRQLRVSWLRNSPLMFGALVKKGVNDEVAHDWTAPGLASADVRRDVRKYGGHPPPKAELIAATERLADFAGPTLVVWAPEGKMMPPEHGPRLAELIPDSRYVEIADAHTMVNEDQPDEFTRHLREFLRDTDPHAEERIPAR
ncbi:alpha/beta fold hydrolase [Solicola gregarius]|uniref:Alpha/beta hydrolase n=1 Tax=Solicola gregarius TaxID=2908642 RepID=A0AA46TEJ5_9ACTN|nr:alpha/beta hydrolase [Solicola gregarius]UYM03695.1 alpha/beta hydrolase [Solicola gregarius]